MRDWSPRFLVDIYNDICQSRRDFEYLSLSPVELRQFAESRGWASWAQYELFLDNYADCVHRLISDENAKIVWEWVGSEENARIVWNAVTHCLERWYKGHIQTKKEFCEDRDEIAELAKRLAGKLAKHYRNPNMPFDVASCVPYEYAESALSAVHPELVSRYGIKGELAKRWSIGAGLPPLHVMLNELGNLARNATHPRKSPKKIHNKSGLRQVLLGKIVWSLYGFGVGHSTSAIATFLYLILDDESINDATVRGDLASQEWRDFFQSQD